MAKEIVIPYRDAASMKAELKSIDPKKPVQFTGTMCVGVAGGPLFISRDSATSPYRMDICLKDVRIIGNAADL